VPWPSSPFNPHESHLPIIVRRSTTTGMMSTRPTRARSAVANRRAVGVSARRSCRAPIGRPTGRSPTALGCIARDDDGADRDQVAHSPPKGFRSRDRPYYPTVHADRRAGSRQRDFAAEVGVDRIAQDCAFRPSRTARLLVLLLLRGRVVVSASAHTANGETTRENKGNACARLMLGLA
jgi:hypothetical protein